MKCIITDRLLKMAEDIDARLSLLYRKAMLTSDMKHRLSVFREIAYLKRLKSINR